MASQEKTESPTPQRRQKARNEGQIAHSIEIDAAVGLLAGTVALRVFGGALIDGVRSVMQQSFQLGSGSELTSESVQPLVASTGLTLIMLTVPLFATMIVAGVGATAVQGGLTLSTRRLRPDFSKLNPLKGVARFWSTRSLVELGKSLLKLSIVGAIVYDGVRSRFFDLVSLTSVPLQEAVTTLSGVVFDTVFRAVVVMGVIAAVDYGYQRWSFERSLRMTRQELRDELQDSEVNPQLRSRLKKEQASLTRQRMMAAVPSANVVITNPTHLAVAVRYDPSISPAPVVVAKGQRAIAERIKSIAREHGVPIVENKPLARALFKYVEVGEAIPIGLYKAMAQVLAFIYRLANQKRRVAR
ncbi:MAG: flagellar biosynthesis protein FlhB [Chloroflexota bacterium]|nr:MAG: flagellar biosynthesis protein FlhB [Chloroflexota bacterium]